MNKFFIKNKNIFQILFILLLSSCSLNSVYEIEQSRTSLSRSSDQEMPEIDPTDSFENLSSFIPSEEWAKVIELGNYYHFQFATKTGAKYWASIYLEGDVTAYKVIYLVIHDTKNIVYQSLLRTRIWRKIDDHTVLAITPILEPEWPDTWTFPPESFLDKPAIIIKNGRGTLNDILETPQSTDFSFIKGPKFFSTVQSRDNILHPVFANFNITPVFNFVLKDGDWVQFQYTAGYWMQYKFYYATENNRRAVLQYRILKDGKTVIDEGAAYAELYMTLDRYQSEGSMYFTKALPGVPQDARWINIFRKPHAGSRGNLLANPFFKKSTFQFEKARGISSRLMDMEAERLVQQLKQEANQ